MTISSGSRAFAALSFVFALGVVGCGSSSSNGGGGTNGSKGGSSGSLGGTIGSRGGSTGTTGTGGALGHGGAIGGGGAGGDCANVPTCLTNLAAACTPSGTCMQQTTTNTTTGASLINICYSNGVKEVINFTTDATATSATFLATISKAGSTCFTESGTGSLDGTGTTVTTVKNAAGATVATITEDNDTGTQTATCGGQTYDITNTDNCGMPMGTTAAGDCVDGACP